MISSFHNKQFVLPAGRTSCSFLFCSRAEALNWSHSLVSAQCYEDDAHCCSTLTTLCSILLLPIRSKGSRAVTGTQPVCSVSSTLWLWCCTLNRRLVQDVQRFGTDIEGPLLPQEVVCYDLSCRLSQCCISSLVCCPGKHPGICASQPPPLLHLRWKVFGLLTQATQVEEVL